MISFLGERTVVKIGQRCARSHVYAGPIAEGGFASVSLVVRREGAFERLFALKRPHPHMLDVPEVRAMFLEEGRVAGLLRDAHVVSVLDVGEDAWGPYLLMPFVEGVSLASIIARAAREDDLLPVSVVLQIVEHCARGLASAHELTDHAGHSMPLVHRDVSPQNVLVGFDGVARVLDFGIAKVLSGGGETTAHVLKGKLSYMAPEQLRFEGASPQTDLYALGAVMFEALAARRLHGGGDSNGRGDDDLNAVARSVLNEPPPDISEFRDDTSVELDRLLFDLLAKDPAHRPASARAVIERLRAISHALYADGEFVDLQVFVATQMGDLRVARQAQRSRLLARVRQRQQVRRWSLRGSVAALVAAGVVGGIWIASHEEPVPVADVRTESADGASAEDDWASKLRQQSVAGDMSAVSSMGELSSPLAEEAATMTGGSGPSVAMTSGEPDTARRTPRRRRRRARRSPMANERGVVRDWW